MSRALGDPDPPPPPAAGVADDIASAGNVIKAIVALLALLPPLAVITGLIDIPPSLGQLVKIVTVPVSVIAVMGIFAQRRAISRWSASRAILVFGACALLGSACAVSYYIFAGTHVIEYRDERLVKPIAPSPEIEEIVDAWGGQYDQALAYSPLGEELRRRLGEESVSAILVMIGLMVLAQLLLVAAMVGFAWHLVSESGRRRA